MSVAAGIVSAALVLDPTTQSVIMSCGATGLIANLKIDPTSTAVIHSVSNAGLTSVLRLDPASPALLAQGAAGLSVACCTSSTPLFDDTPTVDLQAPAGVLEAHVIPNLLAGLENQPGGVSIHLQGDPATVPDVCENRLRFVVGTGDLTFLPDGMQMIAVIDGTKQDVPLGAPSDSANSISTTFTNTRFCSVYAVFETHLNVQLTPANDTVSAAGRRADYQGRVVSGGATTGIVVGGIGAWTIGERDNTNIPSIAVLTRMRGICRIAFLLAPGGVAQANGLVRSLEIPAAYISTQPASFIQATENRWYISTVRQ